MSKLRIQEEGAVILCDFFLGGSEEALVHTYLVSATSEPEGVHSI
jgi:hypothetical protein